MSALKKDLQAVVRELKRLTQKADKIAARIDKVGKAPAPKKAKPKPAAKKPAARRPAARRPAARKPVKKKVAAKGKKMSASETIYSIVKKTRSKKGVDSDMLEKMTGFNNQKIRDNIYKLNKRGKIKRTGRGYYVAA